MNVRTVSLALVCSLSAAGALAQPAPAPDAPAAPAAPAPGTPAPPDTPAATATPPPAPAPKVDEAAAALAPKPGGLTREIVARRSVGTSHSVRARLAELDAAQARLDRTTAQFLPRLTLRASYTRLSPVAAEFGEGALVGARTPGPLSVEACPLGQCVVDSAGLPVGAVGVAIESLENNYALSASLSIPLSDYILTLSDAAASASASRTAAELAVRAERLKVRTDAQALFYDWLRAQARVAIAKKSLERTQARLNDARPAFELGVITKADLMRLEALAASTEQIVLEATQFEKLAALQLAIAMGDTRADGYANGEDIAVPLPPTTGTLESLTQEGLRNRLELKSLEEGARSARYASKAAGNGRWPRIEAFADVTYANPNQRYFPPTQEWQATWSVGAAATWTLGDVMVNGASARELDAQARSLAAQRAALADAIRQEIATFFLARAEAEGALSAARRELAAAEEAYRVATDLYRVGKATTTEVIEAETDLLSARLNELNARIRMRIAEVRLRHAAGRDTREPS